MPSRRWETERSRRVSRSMSAAEGMFSAPIATSCAWAAFSRASNARPIAPVNSGFSSSSESALPRRPRCCRSRRSRRLLATLLASDILGSRSREAGREPAAASATADGKDTVQRCPNGCSCSCSWSSPGSSARPTGATCCARSRTASPSTWSCSSTLGAGASRRARAAVDSRDRAAAPARGAPSPSRRRSRRRARRSSTRPALGRAPGTAWLAELDREREVPRPSRCSTACSTCTASPPPTRYVHEVSPAQALVIRAGWGEGEQVADGLWLHAASCRWRGRGSAAAPPDGERAAALRPQERLAALLGARGDALLCEELALRARLDLDQGRLAHAAIELDGALRRGLPSCAGSAARISRSAHRRAEQLRERRRSCRRERVARGGAGRPAAASERRDGRTTRSSCATRSSAWKRRCGRARRAGV